MIDRPIDFHCRSARQHRLLAQSSTCETARVSHLQLAAAHRAAEYHLRAQSICIKRPA